MSAASLETSALVGRVFDPTLTDKPFTVLDLGGASPETVAFLSQFRCRLSVSGLIEDRFLPEPPTDEDPYRAHRAFKARLAPFRGERFDVCLLWDYANYLPSPTLRAFGEVLADHLYPRSRGHAFAVLNASTKLPPARYGVHDLETLASRAENEPPMANGHTQGELCDALPYFKPARSSLRDGRVEVLLEHV